MRVPGLGVVLLVIALWLEELRKKRPRTRAPKVIPKWVEEEVRRNQDDVR